MAQRRAVRHRVTPGVLAYLQANADRVVTIREVVEATGFQPSSVSGSLRALARDLPERVTKRRQGSYQYSSKALELDSPKEATPTQGQALLLTFVSASTNPTSGVITKLMRDDDTGDLYVVRPFTFEY